MESKNYKSLFYNKYDFLELTYDEFDKLIFNDMIAFNSEIQLENNVKEKVVRYIDTIIKTNKTQFTNIFEKASKCLGYNELFSLFNLYVSKYNYNLTDEDLDYICDLSTLQPFYKEQLKKFSVSDEIDNNDILNKVLEIYSVSNSNNTEDLDSSYFINDSFKLLIKDISNIPLLTPEEEKDLFIRLKNGEDVKNQIIEANIRLVINIAKFIKTNRNVGSSIELVDLIQSGIIGLNSAVDRFDVDKGNKFSTYAFHWIEQSIRRFVDTSSKAVYIPVYKSDRMKRLAKIMGDLNKEGIENPSTEEISNRSGFTCEEVEELRSLMSDAMSLDMKLQGDDKDADSLIDFMYNEEENGFNFADNLYIDDKNKDLYKAINIFDLRTRFVLILRFGLYGYKEHKLNEIGEYLGVSRERIRIIESNALEVLKILLRKYSVDYDQKPLFENIHINLLNESGEETNLHHKFELFNTFLNKIDMDAMDAEIVEFNPYTYTVRLKCKTCGEETIENPYRLTSHRFKCKKCANEKAIRKYQDMIDQVNPNVKLIEYTKFQIPSRFRCESCGTEWISQLNSVLRNPQCIKCNKTRRRNNKNNERRI